jgi:hypothetical protein
VLCERDGAAAPLLPRYTTLRTQSRREKPLMKRPATERVAMRHRPARMLTGAPSSTAFSTTPVWDGCVISSASCGQHDILQGCYMYKRTIHRTKDSWLLLELVKPDKTRPDLFCSQPITPLQLWRHSSSRQWKMTRAPMEWPISVTGRSPWPLPISTCASSRPAYRGGDTSKGHSTPLRCNCVTRMAESRLQGTSARQQRLRHE